MADGCYLLVGNRYPPNDRRVFYRLDAIDAIHADAIAEAVNADRGAFEPPWHDFRVSSLPIDGLALAERVRRERELDEADVWTTSYSNLDRRPHPMNDATRALRKAVQTCLRLVRPAESKNAAAPERTTPIGVQVMVAAILDLLDARGASADERERIVERIEALRKDVTANGLSSGMIGAGEADRWHREVDGLVDPLARVRRGILSADDVKRLTDAAIYFDDVCKRYRPDDYHATTGKRMSRSMAETTPKGTIDVHKPDSRGQRHRLTDREKAVYTMLRDLPLDGGLTGAAIVERLSNLKPPIHMDNSTLTRQIIPRLKADYGVTNRRGVGYYIPESPPSA